MKPQFLSTIAVACLLLTASSFAQTSTYSVPGVHIVVVPPLAKVTSVKLWGAGGGNGIFAGGGGGAFTRTVFAVTPGETYVVVVGQRGAQSSASLGGSGSGNTEGGAPGFLGDYNERGQGGQASSVFKLTNGFYVMKSVAGAGGGAGRNAGGGGGGQAGVGFSGAIGGLAGANGIGGAGGGNGLAGGDYASTATTTGISSLNLAGGNGGNAGNWSGGGGGGYGGGGGGGGGAAGDGAGGGGGGSFGEVILPGSGSQPGNTLDADCVAGAGSAANDGLVVVAFTTNAFAPSVATLPATDHQLDGATLNASVNPAGETTTYYFQHGTTTGYGNSTASQTLPSGTTAIPVNQTISGLLADTLYHFRVVASNSVGVVNGPDVTFTTVSSTNRYQTAGVYTNTVPEKVGKMTVKLWGAGGGSSALGGNGGGGAFSSVTLDVTPGENYVVVVGQRGAADSASLGGIGSGNTQGGAPGFLGNYNDRGQGGQASSIFRLNSGFLVMKAVAGAGGGAGLGRNGGAGGQPGGNGSSSVAGQPGSNGTGGPGGAAGSPGSDYPSDAITTGISSLNLANGNGGDANNWSGGGGYGGGGGGGGGVNGSGAGGGGGGSYGTSITLGSGSQPGNTSDPDYPGNAGMGGAGSIGTGRNPGNDGAAVVIWTRVVVGSGATLKNPKLLGNGSFQFSFTNISGASFTALGTTNISLGLSNWNVLGTATEVSPGQFQFTDPQATNFPRRFYILRSP